MYVNSLWAMNMMTFYCFDVVTPSRPHARRRSRYYMLRPRHCYNRNCNSRHFHYNKIHHYRHVLGSHRNRWVRKGLRMCRLTRRRRSQSTDSVRTKGILWEFFLWRNWIGFWWVNSKRIEDCWKHMWKA